MKTTRHPQGDTPLWYISYKIVKKIVKYSFYAVILYFAYEGFMAWD